MRSFPLEIHILMTYQDYQYIIDWLIEDFKNDQGIDLAGDPMAMQRLKEESEKAKMALSSSQSTDINLPFITADSSGPKHLNVTLSRSKLEQICDDLYERTHHPGPTPAPIS